MTELYSKFSEEVAFPRGLIIWNYFEHYHQIRVLAEEDKWCFSQRSAALPLIPIKMWATQFCYLKSDKWMRSFHFGPFGLLLEQDFHFEDLGRQGCRVTVESRIDVPRIFLCLQPFFHKLMRRWFYSVWAEDTEMR